MRQLCVCQPTRKPPTTRPTAIHARVLRGTIGSQLHGLLIKGVPRLTVRLSRSPGSDIQIPRGLLIARSRESVRVGPQQQSSEPGGQDVVVLQGLPHLRGRDRKSTRLNSSHVRISYAVFCLKKK